MIFFIKIIVFNFIVISTTFRPICPPSFFRCLSNSVSYTKLRTTSFIESTGAACSDSVCHNRLQVLSIPVFLLRFEPVTARWLSPQKPTLITVTLCVLLDSLEWIFGTYKLNVLTWLGLLELCMIFLPALIFRFSYLTFLIIGSHIVFISILGLLSRSL